MKIVNLTRVSPSKDRICWFCRIKDCYGCDNYSNFEPLYQILPNYDGGSQAEWNYSWNFTRKLVFERDKHKCSMCKKDLSNETYHVDHIRERMYKGSNHPRNLRLICPECHKALDSRKHAKYIRELEAKAKREKYWNKLLGGKKHEK